MKKSDKTLKLLGYLVKEMEDIELKEGEMAKDGNIEGKIYYREKKKVYEESIVEIWRKL